MPAILLRRMRNSVPVRGRSHDQRNEFGLIVSSLLACGIGNYLDSGQAGIGLVSFLKFNANER